MRIKVLFFGALKDVVGRTEESVTIEEGASIAALYDLYAARFPRLVGYAPSMLFSLNREFVQRAAALREGDEVAFLPPVSGGVPEDESANGLSASRTIVRLTRRPIDSCALANELKRGFDGAAVIFEGVVRDHS